MAEDVCFENRISSAPLGLLDDHGIDDFSVLPAGAILDMMLAAISSPVSGRCLLLQQVSFLTPVRRVPGQPLMLQLRVQDGTCELRSRSSDEELWSRHAACRVQSELPPCPEYESMALRWQLSPVLPLRTEEWYHRQRIRYGPTYRIIRRILSDGESTLGLLRPKEEYDTQVIHPAVLDGVFQLLGMAQGAERSTELVLPWRIDRLRVRQKVRGAIWCRLYRTRTVAGMISGDAKLLNEQGEILAELEGIVLKSPSPRVAAVREAGIPAAEVLSLSSLSSLSSLHQELRWEEKEQEAGGERVPEGRWLVVGEQTELGRELGTALRQRGAEVIGVSEGNTFEAVSAQDYRLDPRSLAHWKLLAAAVGEVAHTVFLLGCGLGAQDALEHSLQRLHPVLMGLVGLASATLGARHRLFVVTQGAVSLGSEAPSLGAALQNALRGLGACLGKEVSRSAVHLVDLPLHQGAQALLWAVCQHPSGADLVLRAGRVYRPKLQQVQLGSDPAAIRAGGCYLLLGGQGELGRAVAMQLGRAGAGAVLLTSQTPVGQSTPQRQQALQALSAALKARGVQLELVSFDAADGQQVRTQLDKAKQRYGRVDGIFHCAGRLADGLIPSLRWDHFEKTMSPKLGTCLALQQALGDSSIDFVVLFSSISGVTGNVGQGAYAAANAAMDGFAREMRARGKPWMSVDFGLWGEIGMGAHLAEALSQRGVHALRTDEALGALFQALSTDKSQILIVKPEQVRTAEPSPALPVRTISSPVQGEVSQRLLLVFRRVLKDEGLTETDNLLNRGLDSMMAVEAATALTDLGVALDPATYFRFPTVNELTAYVTSDGQRAEVARQAPMPVPMIDIDKEPAVQPAVQRPRAGGFLSRRLAEMNREDYETLARGEYFYEPLIQRSKGAWIRIGDRELLNFASYSYLGLIGHPQIDQAARDAVGEFGSGTQGVRLLAGTNALHRRLEQAIARFKGTEDAAVFSCGYLTNLSTISALVRHGDIVIGDQLNHASIVDGCRLSEATFRTFLHNQPEDLERELRRDKDVGKLVIVDAVFSMDGDIADLPRIADLCQRYDAALMVDEAHSIGVLGSTGRGIEEHFSLPANTVPIKMGTLSKAIPSLGGYIAGSRELVFALKNSARGFIFSAALPPAQAAAALAAISVIEKEPDRITRLRQRVDRYARGLKSLGFDTLSSASPIVPIICRNTQQAIAAARACQQEGLFIQPIVYPAVPLNKPRLRTIVTLSHGNEDIDVAMEILARVGRKVDLI